MRPSLLHRTLVIAAVWAGATWASHGVVLGQSSSASAQSPVLEDGRGLAKATVAGRSVTVDYGRPSLQGRDMLAQAEAGTPWRMGKDAPTQLHNEVGLQFGERLVPAGDYILTATKQAEGSWTLDVWKTDPDNPRRRGDLLAAIPLTSGKTAAAVETFTVTLSGGAEAGEFRMEWGQAAFSAPFKAAKTKG